MAPLAAKSLLSKLVAIDGQMLAIGERGHVLRSKAGKVWLQQQVPTEVMLTGVSNLGNDVWAVGHDASILASTDGGKTWQLQHLAPEWQKPLMDVHFYSKTTGIAVGAYGIFLRTVDGGKSWQKEAHPSLLSEEDQEYLEEIRDEDEAFYLEELNTIMPHFNALYVWGETTVLVGETGLVALSQDQGKSWERLPMDYYGSFFAATVDNGGRVVVAGLRGNVFRLSLQGDDWQKLTLDAKANLNAAINLPNGHILVAGNSGIYALIDNQGNISESKLASGKAITSLALINNQVFATTESGITRLDGVVLPNG